MPLPDATSLYSLLRQNQTRLTNRGAQMFHTTLDTLAQHKGLPLERYEKVTNGSYYFLKDDKITELLFDTKTDALRKQCIGDISKDDFKQRFRHGLQLYRGKKDQLLAVFTYTAFPESYFHPQIAAVLRNSGKLAQASSAETRIRETGVVILQAVNSSSCLATMALVAGSHLIRHLTGNDNYNADTVEFTLLTFSYFGAKRAGVKEDDWFFYWRVFGSMMGLGPDRLQHDKYGPAKARMKELHKQCPQTPTADSIHLLDVFIEAFGLKTNTKVEELNQQGLFSKRMHAYLVSKGLWPSGLQHISTIA
jgi:hypothetical protein